MAHRLMLAASVVIVLRRMEAVECIILGGGRATNGIY